MFKKTIGLILLLLLSCSIAAATTIQIDELPTGEDFGELQFTVTLDDSNDMLFIGFAVLNADAYSALINAGTANDQNQTEGWYSGIVQGTTDYTVFAFSLEGGEEAPYIPPDILDDFWSEAPEGKAFCFYDKWSDPHMGLSDGTYDGFFGYTSGLEGSPVIALFYDETNESYIAGVGETGQAFDVGAGAPAPGPVPEPATMLLFGIGLLGLAGVSRKKE